MRKEVLCALVVLLSGGLVHAQPANGPTGQGGPDGQYPGYPQPSGAVPAYYQPSGADPNGPITPVDYPYSGGYGYGYDYGPGNPYGYGPQVQMGLPPWGDAQPPDPTEKVKEAPVVLSPVRKDICWLSANYAMVLFRPMTLSAPLVTTGSTADPHPGALGQPGTAVTFGGQNLDFGLMSGIQAEAGFFLDDERHFSFDASGFYVVPAHVKFAAASDPTGAPLIARPIFNTATGIEAAEATAQPGVLSGSTAVDASTQLWGAEVNGRYYKCLTNNLQFDCLAGFRTLHLDERLTIQDHVTPLLPGALTFRGAGNPLGVTQSITDMDDFSTTNAFYGANFGGRLRWQYDWFSLSVFGKVAVGVTDEKVHIQGSTTLFTPLAAPQTTTGGILALPSNIGNHNRTVFGIVPEAGLTVGIDAVKHVRILAGYSFLYWNNVARPGSQIDRAVNPAQIPSDQGFGIAPGTGHPAFTFKQDTFWTQTFTVGVEVYY
jgi:Putative beta barrel porin-7 (BBP7)